MSRGFELVERTVVEANHWLRLVIEGAGGSSSLG